MYLYKIKGEAEPYAKVPTEDSNSREDYTAITDLTVNELSALVEAESLENMTDYFSGSSTLEDKFVADYNAHLYFEYEPKANKLFSVTCYKTSESLTNEEQNELMVYTQGQWSDGVGEGFEQWPCQFREDAEYYIRPWTRGQTLTIECLESN